MRDPHVEWLEYEMTAGWLFADPPPLDWETPGFQANLDRGILPASAHDEGAAATLKARVMGTEASALLSPRSSRKGGM